ncbi:MAG: ATP-binding protein [Methylococcales bacterium]
MSYQIDFANDFAHFDILYAGIGKHLDMMNTGTMNGLIISGPPGVGKSFEVSRYLEAKAKDNYFRIKGHATELSLYLALYNYRYKGQIIVLDDTDSIVTKLEGLNILKAATDSGNREISWESTTNRLGDSPSSFPYNGSVVIITNVAALQVSNKLKPHMNALQDRCSRIVISDGNEDTLFKQICFMVYNRHVLTNKNIPPSVQEEMLQYIDQNKRKLRSLSLRALDRMVTYYDADPTTWKQMSNLGLLK